MISAEISTQAQFYDLDPMQIVWHGNYARYLEQARCALLDKSNRSPPSRSNCDRNREVMQVRSGAGESVGDV